MKHNYGTKLIPILGYVVLQFNVNVVHKGSKKLLTIKNI